MSYQYHVLLVIKLSPLHPLSFLIRLTSLLWHVELTTQSSSTVRNIHIKKKVNIKKRQCLTSLKVTKYNPFILDYFFQFTSNVTYDVMSWNVIKCNIMMSQMILMCVFMQRRKIFNYKVTLQNCVVSINYSRINKKTVEILTSSSSSSSSSSPGKTGESLSTVVSMLTVETVTNNKNAVSTSEHLFTGWHLSILKPRGNSIAALAQSTIA